MSEFKGTPGKWEMQHSRISWWIESPKDMSRFISGPIPCDVWQQEKEQRDNCEALNNARLIAAAPDLLEALQWAIAEIEGRTRYHPNDIYEAEDQRENALGCARAAIAKALQP